MKLLLLNYEYSPLGGGAGIATKYLLREFAKYPDLEIDLVTSSLDRARDERVSDKVRVHCLDIGKKNKNRLFQSEKDLLVYSVK